MRKLTYSGPIDTLEIFNPQDPTKVLFSEHLHPGRTYKLPDGEFQVVENMIARGLFSDPKAETEPSPGIDTSPGAPAPATVAGTTAEAAGKSKRS